MGHVRYAQVLFAQGNFAAAEKYLKQALEFQPAGPVGNSYEVCDALFGLWSAYGDLKIRAGLAGEAIELYRRPLDLSIGLAREPKIRSQPNAASALPTPSWAMPPPAPSAPSEALGYLRVALEIDKRLAAANPNNTSMVRKLFVTCALLGELLREGPGPQPGCTFRRDQLPSGRRGCGHQTRRVRSR
jgi:tetratricopeptide (TPR) repeat protein